MRVPPKKGFEAFIATLPTMDLFNDGPVQFLFPETFHANCARLREQCDTLPFPVHIYFAHKATKSSVFVQEAKRAGVRIDVASYNELCNALDAGYTGADIECTGIKNERYIDLAVKHDCLLIIDGMYELDMVPLNARILVRVSNAFGSSYTRTTRFGVPKEKIVDILDMGYKVEGLHIHFDEYVPENKRMLLDELLSLYTHLFKKGIPTIVNIGGGYRAPLVDNVQGILEQVEHADFDNLAYANTVMGLPKGRNGKLSKTMVKNKLAPMSTFDFLQKVVSGTLIDDLGLTLSIEPGYALLDQCAVTVMRVLGVKEGMVVVDGNMYNLSTQMKKWVTDPVLVSDSDTERFEGYIVGNLCKEDDVLMDRKIMFDRTPQRGDLLVFCNTAGYSGFEDSNAILQPTVKQYVVRDGVVHDN